jgi:hypothetical protein
MEYRGVIVHLDGAYAKGIGIGMMPDKYFTDKSAQPGDQEMVDAIGQPAASAWVELRQFLSSTYEVDPVVGYGGGEWFMRYKRGSRPLCELTARKGCFRVLVVLGKKEVEKAEAILERFGPNVRRTFEGAAQFHDGRWLWIMVPGSASPEDGLPEGGAPDELACMRDVRDIEELVLIKVRPARKKMARD